MICCTKMKNKTIMKRYIEKVMSILGALWAHQELCPSGKETMFTFWKMTFKCKVDILDFDSRSHLQIPADQGAFVHTKGLLETRSCHLILMPISEYLHFLQMYIVNFSHQSNSRFTHVCQSLYCQSLKIIKSDCIFLYCLLDSVNPSFEYLWKSWQWLSIYNV